MGGKEGQKTENVTVFTSKAAVLRWLEENGWQIKKSQFYDHCRDGLLRPVKSGVNKGKYKLSTVERYARLNCRRGDTGEKESDREMRLREQKMEVDLEQARIRRDREQFDLNKARGKFIPRAEFDQALVARAVAFMAHLNHTIQQSVPDWIDLVEGDQSHAPELVEVISLGVQQRMGDFAADGEIDVLLEAN